MDKKSEKKPKRMIRQIKRKRSRIAIVAEKTKDDQNEDTGKETATMDMGSQDNRCIVETRRNGGIHKELLTNFS